MTDMQSAANKRVRTALLSNQGRRPSNQDRILLVPQNVPSNFLIAAVADGMGGMLAGDRAAEIAVETLKDQADSLVHHMNLSFTEMCGCVFDVYGRANGRIQAYAESLESPGAMGTTLTTLIVSDLRFVVAHVGDSRCYRIDENGPVQLTRDHTVADELVRSGAIAGQDYDTSVFRNQLTRSVGTFHFCEVDIIPELDFGAISRPCTFLLCSDGFYASLKHPDVMRLADASVNLEHVLEELSREALERGTTDNLSAVVVQYPG